MRRSAGRVIGTGALALAAVLGVGFDARADEHEWYTLIGYRGGVSHYRTPVEGAGSATRYVGGIDFTSYYGITGDLHVGGRIGLSRSGDVKFSGVSIPSVGAGNLYLDHLSVSIVAVVVFRLQRLGVTFRNDSCLAPVLDLELGLGIRNYRNIEQVPTGGDGKVSVPNVTETVAQGAGSVLLEYRFLEHWVASAGVGARLESGHTPWSLFVPIRIGRIW